MVIGNGLIASAFEQYKNNDNVIIFASGVSNSLETNPKAFNREKSLLLETLKKYPNKRFVYFSTCSIQDQSVKNRAYTSHKINMEKLVAEHSRSYLIFRLSNIVGKQGNSNTIINYIINSVNSGTEIQVWKNASRNILDVEDLSKIVFKIISSDKSNQIINVANFNSYPIMDIISRIEVFTGKKAKLNILNKGLPVEIDVEPIKQYLEELSKDLSIKYIDSLLEKYY